MDKTLISFIGGSLIVAFVFFAIMTTVFFPTATSGAAVIPVVKSLPQQPSGSQGDVQVVNFSAQGINYSPNVITVKVNQPVRLVADVASLQGCLRSFIIPALNVRKIFTENDNTVEFTPTQKGSFQFSCGMGMGRGTINVV